MNNENHVENNQPKQLDRIDLEFPKFKYHLDPIKSKVFIKGESICPVCNRINEYRYDLAFYAIEEVEDICPWCIADGSAAKKYDGMFNDDTGCENVSNKEYLFELLYRTPSYAALQTEQWLSHCDDYCMFIEYVGWKEIKDIVDELKDDIERIKAKYRMSQEEFEKWLINDGSFQGYLFRCVNCGKHRLAVDMD